jgi:penicillin-binding protein 2
MQENRHLLIIWGALVLGGIYLIRLFSLQVLDESYAIQSSANSIKKIVEIPPRGQIYDRYGNLIVYNTPVYDLLVTPNKAKVRDTLRLCRTLGIERSEFDSLMNAAKSYSKVKPSMFLRQLSKEEFAHIQDVMVDYPGFEFERSSVRTYTTASMANALGYVSEISKKQLEAQKEPYYRQGDYVGQSGLEKFYETALRGKRGTRFVMVNVNGIRKGAWKGGELDTSSVVGKNLYTGIDLMLQQYADSLLVNKVGSVVAIEPKTGQILTIASSPTYDPRMLTNRSFSKNYMQLYRNPYKPLFNRAVMSSYRPGSTFKLVQALVALQEGVITPGTGFAHGSAPMKCHGHPHIATVAMGVQHSCNPYFYHVFRKVLYDNDESNTFAASAQGLARWHEIASKFSMGEKLGVDLPSEFKGNVPSDRYYDGKFGKGKWKFSNIYSISIGEGELLTNPIKLANLAAIIANRGYFYTPHIVAAIGSEDGKPEPEYLERRETHIDPRHYETVIEGMKNAVVRGTVPAFAQLSSGIVSAGKTGTSQNPKGEDNSIFIAFAPVDDPKIAIAVIVEYAGFGGSHAGPIANLLIERYLKRETISKSVENYVLRKNYLPNYIFPKGTIFPKKEISKDSLKPKRDTLIRRTPDASQLATRKDSLGRAILTREGTKRERKDKI